MQDLENRSLIQRLDLKKCNAMADQELVQLLDKNLNQIGFIPVLIELCKRQAKQIETLAKRVDYLEDKALKKPGRKRQRFYFQGKELSAGKNQLRNRYNKAKKNLKIQREMDSDGNM